MCLQVCAIAVYMFSLISKNIQDRCIKPFGTNKPLNIGKPKSWDNLEFGKRGSQQKKTTNKISFVLHSYWHQGLRGTLHMVSEQKG